MISETSTLDAAAVLAAARRARAEENRAAAEVLVQVVAWARLHEVTDVEDAATWWVGSQTMGQDTGIPLAGPGAPLVSEFAVAELAAALGLSAGSGRVLVAHALELAHRLPRVWARVQAGSLPAWRARRIAEETLTLSVDAAAWVDAMVAPFAHKTGPAQTQRLVEDAIAKFMPEYATERRDRAADQRHLTVEHDQVSFAGTSRIHGELDLADALDLEDALAAGAEQLKALGSTETLDVRRAAALGVLARGQFPLDLQPGPAAERPGVSTRQREVVLYVHLSEDALRGHQTDSAHSPVWLEDAGGQLLTAGQVAGWCRLPETTKVTVKPVLDLNQRQAVDGYQPPDRIAEHVRLRDRTCVFPHCQRPGPRLRPGPPRPLRPHRRRRPTRPDLDRQPRLPVPPAPPDEDPQRLDLHHGRTRHLPLALTPRPHLAPRRHRHHRPHPGNAGPARTTNQLTQPRRTRAGGGSGTPGGDRAAAEGEQAGLHRGPVSPAVPPPPRGGPTAWSAG